MVRRMAALLAALTLTLLAVTPAFATVPLHQGGDIDWNDAEFQGDEDECEGVVLEPGEVLWHFVLVHAETNEETLTLDFEDDAYDVTGMSPTQISPDNDMADHYVLHWTVITSQTTLVSAESTGDPAVSQLNLSHICAGTPPPEIPEAPASALLLAAGAVGILGFFALRQRRAGSLA